LRYILPAAFAMQYLISRTISDNTGTENIKIAMKKKVSESSWTSDGFFGLHLIVAVSPIFLPFLNASFLSTV